MQGNLMWTVKLLHVAIDRLFPINGHETDLSLTQAMILRLLYSLDGSGRYAVNLCDSLGISHATMSSALKALKRKGYLEIVGDAADDRRKLLVLTEKARCMEQSISLELQKQQMLLCRNIPSEHLQWLEEDLKIMIQNLKNEKTGQEEPSYAENTSITGKTI